jgi:tryptophanyl-tRNA synthetase
MSEISENSKFILIDPPLTLTSDAVQNVPSDDLSDIISNVTPWDVHGSVNYYAQAKRFGVTLIDGKLIERWEKVTKTKVHHLIRRGVVFSHQDLDKILDCVESGTPVYIYTGRGPSSDKMHLGHLIPFKLAVYLQQTLKCIVFVQMSDDEKYIFKGGSGPMDLEKYREYSYKNAKDIIACGFDPDKTLIFSNLSSNSGDLYFNNVLIMKAVNMAEIKAIYGLGEILPDTIITILKKELQAESLKSGSTKDHKKIEDLETTLHKFSATSTSNIGKCVWPVFQSGPAFCTSFKKIFIDSIKKTLRDKGTLMPKHVVASMKRVLKELSTLGKNQSIMCLVPMAIDQAVYFRMCRDVHSVLKCPKPAVIHSEFLPSLKQVNSKMSTTDTEKTNTTIFLDMNKKDVKKLIRHASSGGRDTLDNHRKYGGNINIDVCYQYLVHLLEHDDELAKIAENFTSGVMTSDELKNFTCEIIHSILNEHQKKLSQIDQKLVDKFFSWDRVLDIGGCYDTTDGNNEDEKCVMISNGRYDYENYDSYGALFDKTFGFKCKDTP